MRLKHVLVTGANGFLGRSLVECLPDFKIISFDKINGDVTTFDFGVYNAECVVHLAALTSVEESWCIPADYYRTNIMGTLNILEYCRKSNASMIYVSTYTYGTPQYLPIDEKHPVSPHSVYNHSKFIAEDVCRFYAMNYDVSLTILRLFNLYGSGQSSNFLIPRIVQQALESEHIELMDLKPKRDYIYITDAIDAIRLSIGKPGNNLYNVGSGHSVSVSELCDIVQECTGTNKPVVTKNKTRKNEIMDVVADCTRIKDELGWYPKVDLKEGIMHVVEGYSVKQVIL